MRRREFIALLGGAAAWPVAVQAQQSDRVRRIGVLSSMRENGPEGQARAAALRQGLEKDAVEKVARIIGESRFRFVEGISGGVGSAGADQPAEELAGAIGRVGQKPLGLQALASIRVIMVLVAATSS